jgi:hypothetical protein
MPYGCLNSEGLSGASLKAMQKVIDRWQTSMQISKRETFLVLSSYGEGYDQELQLRKDLISQHLTPEEFSTQVIEIRAKDEEDLASKIARNKKLAPIQSLILFAEARHAIGIRPIFRRKFRKALEIKTFKAEFESNHPWISTSTSFAWLARNLILRLSFGIRERAGRRLRKTLRTLFWS